VEHDPLEIWTRIEELIRRALRGGSLTAENFAAVGITNQRETTLVWDKHTGEPVCNAIAWLMVLFIGERLISRTMILSIC
jgi:glycerol kinase